MRNNILDNKDRLQYSYDNQGKVFLIQNTDSTGAVFARSFFTYDGEKLVKIERLHKEGTGFIIDRTLTMTYTADGNLQELSDHRPAIEGQNESTVVDQYEQYKKIGIFIFCLFAITIYFVEVTSQFKINFRYLDSNPGLKIFV